jgi:hypothetical protein
MIRAFAQLSLTYPSAFRSMDTIQREFRSLSTRWVTHTIDYAIPIAPVPRRPSTSQTWPMDPVSVSPGFSFDALNWRLAKLFRPAPKYPPIRLRGFAPAAIKQPGPRMSRSHPAVPSAHRIFRVDGRDGK